MYMSQTIFFLLQLKIKHLTRIPPEPITAGATLETSDQMTAHPEPSLDKLAAFKYEELRNLESLDICIDDYLFGVNKWSWYLSW